MGQVKIRPLRKEDSRRGASSRRSRSPRRGYSPRRADSPRGAIRSRSNGRAAESRRRPASAYQEAERDWQLEEIQTDEGVFLHDIATGRIYEETEENWVRPCGTLGKDGRVEWDERDSAIDAAFFEHLDAYLRDEDLQLEELFNEMDVDGAPCPAEPSKPRLSMLCCAVQSAKARAVRAAALAPCSVPTEGMRPAASVLCAAAVDWPGGGLALVAWRSR